MGQRSLIKFYSGLVCGLAGYCCSGTGNAQDTENLYDLSLEELLKINISTNRAPATSSTLPFKVTVITEQEIHRQLALDNDTAQILANLIPSFSPSRQKLSGLGETLRGGSPLIMVDGVPQSNPLRDSSRDGYVIDLEMVKSIEVIYGANAIQGMGATGGIINFITRDAATKGGSTTSLLTGLSFTDDPANDTTGYKFGVEHREQLDNLSLLIAATLEERGLYKDGNGMFVGLEQIQGDIEDTKSHDVLIKTNYSWQQQQLQLTYNNFEIFSHGDYVVVPGNIQTGLLTSTKPGSVFGEPPGNLIENAAIDYQNNEIWSGKVSTKLFLECFKATFGATNTAIFQDPTLGKNIYDQSQVHSNKIGLKFNYYKSGIADLPLDLSAGLDLLDDKNIQKLLLTHRVWSPEMHFRSWSPFFQASYHLSDHFTLNGSLRHEMAQLDVNDYRTIASSGNTLVGGGQLDFNKTLFNIGAIYELTPHWNLVFNDGEGFGMPDAGRELRAINTPNMNVSDIFEIAPLITENREWGIYYSSNQWQAQLSYFESTTEHGTQLQVMNSVYRLDREPSTVDGWEINSRWQLSDNAHVGVMYSNIRGRKDSNGDKDLDSDLTAMDIPPQRLGVNWNQQWSSSWSSYLQWYRDFSRDFKTLNAKTTYFEGYSLVDANITYQSSYGNISLGISNIANTQYTTYFSQAATRNDRLFAGHGRFYHLQYRVHF